MTYSIDMIRLKCYITYEKYLDLEFRLDTIWSEFVEKKYTSSQMKNFFYNYVIKDKSDNTFWFGFLHNTEKRKEDAKETYNLTIEFNPNKLKDNNIILYILNMSNDYFIKSYDLAVDIPINILDLVVDKGLKKSVKIFSNGFDNKTYEIGKGDMRFKVYNKKIESNLDIDTELTRVEISRILDDFPINRIKLYKYTQEGFPEIYTNDYICSLSDYQDKTLYAIVYAVQSGFPINQLSRVYKNKIKNLFEGNTRLRFTALYATQALHKTIFSYFINNEKIRWF